MMVMTSFMSIGFGTVRFSLRHGKVMNMTQTIENVTVQIAVDKVEAFAKVNRGTELRRLIEENTKELDEIKAYLREAAKTGAFPATETGTVEIRDPQTELCAQVIPCKDTPVLIKGVDTSKLKADLTKGQFDLMFREVVQMQPVEGFERAFDVTAKRVQNIVRRFVAWRPNEHQVRFSK